MNILMIDDHRLVVDGIRALLQESKFERLVKASVKVDAAYNVKQALDLLNRESSYELVLLDLSMPKLNGFDFLDSLKGRKINTPIIVLSASTDAADMNKAYNLGARGFIGKFEPAEEMLKKISNVVKGERCYPDAFSPSLSSANPKQDTFESSSSLGERQIEVLKLIASGKSNKEISLLLGVTESTVKFHIKNIFDVFNVRSRTLCVKEAMRRGLV